MISGTTLALFAAASLVLVVSPGPNHLYIVTRGVAQGRAAGLASAFGVEAATLVHVAAAAAGLSYLVARSATLFAVVKWAGVAYLVYLGVRTLAGRAQTAEEVVRPQPLRRVFLEGMLVNLLNPKVILFFLAFLPQFVEPGAGSPAAQIVVLGLTVMVLGLASDMVYAFGAGVLGARLRARARLLKNVSGMIYVGLGVAMAFSGGRASS